MNTEVQFQTHTKLIGNYIRHSVEAYNTDNKKLIGDFIIEGEISRSVGETRYKDILMNEAYYGFNTGNTMSMSIMVKNEYQGLGISRMMIKTLCEYIENIIPFEIRTDQMIFIDADASNGFWDYVGMKENRYYDRYKISREGCGYEKVITWNKLKKWASI